jgi:hypothetical protein
MVVALKPNIRQWDSLMIPIGMAFFFYGTAAGKTLALYHIMWDMVHTFMQHKSLVESGNVEEEGVPANEVHR